MKHKKISERLSFLMSIPLAIVPLLGFFAPTIASADTGTCTPENTIVNVVAHHDDDLLFQNPDILHDIQSGRCVKTIYMTASDAGSIPSYWSNRESGVKAAYAHMAGISNTWNQSDAGISGHAIPVFRLANNPNISLIFLRLPDGNLNGSGFGKGSLQKLWGGSIETLTTADDSSTYTRQNLIDTLLSLIISSQPSRINTHDYIGTFGGGDHSDHYATASFTKSAHELYITPHTLYGYLGYLSTIKEINVSKKDLALKKSAFFTYTPYDSTICQTDAECIGSYEDWLNRQYIVGSENGGVIDTCPNLDGNQTTIPNGYQLDNGQCVVKPEICESVVSDTSDMTGAETHATEISVSPLWTAGANIPGATWIWNSPSAADGETVAFTKQINVTGTITSAPIVIAADDFYEASLNGTQFGASTDFNNFTAGNEDTYDVSSLLHSGQNTLTITVHNVTANTSPEFNPAGLRYKLDITKSSCDVTVPIIRNIAPSFLNFATGTISWITDEPSTSQVEYGTNTSYASSTTLKTEATTTHSVGLTGLLGSTTYHFRVQSTDASSNTATSDDQTFTTPATPVNKAPVITLNGSNPVNLTVGDSYTEAGATTTDTEDGVTTVVISGTVNTAVVGTYTLTYKTTDTGGISASVTRTVNVKAKNGGGSYVPPQLKISNQATAKASSGKILLTWKTNNATYGHVIYGIDTVAPYKLDLTKSNFGYPQSVPTDPSVLGHLDPQGKVKKHSFALTNLIPGKKYRYRTISHASPPVMSDEYTFTVPVDGTDVVVTPETDKVAPPLQIQTMMQIMLLLTKEKFPI